MNKQQRILVSFICILSFSIYKPLAQTKGYFIGASKKVGVVILDEIGDKLWFCEDSVNLFLCKWCI